ncbi:MAG: CSLREA domain-containing protein [Thermomicrobiales bacterium]
MHRRTGYRTRIVVIVLAALLATLFPTTLGATNFSVTVTTTADSTNTCATSGTDTCSLRDAIAFANTHSGTTDLTTITLPANINPYTLTNGHVNIQANVTINGGGRARRWSTEAPPTASSRSPSATP